MLNEFSKYEIILNELSSLETQIQGLKNPSKDFDTKKVKELEHTLGMLKKENEYLKEKIEFLEENRLDNDFDLTLFGSMNTEEKQDLKVKLQNLLTKIEKHVSS